MLYTFCNKMMYGRRQKKFPICRPYNGTGNTVPFPFRSRLNSVLLVFLSVFNRFRFVPGQLVRSSERPGR